MAQKVKIPCPKCDAKGVIPQYFYNRKGICFLCWGAKYIMVKVPSGKTAEEVQAELIKKEKPDFKKNPPKVAMPHKDEIKNPKYFPNSNSKVDIKPIEKPPKPKFNDGEPETPQDIKVDDVKQISKADLEKMTVEELTEQVKKSEAEARKLRDRQNIWRTRKTDGKIEQHELINALSKLGIPAHVHEINADLAETELDKRKKAEPPTKPPKKGVVPPELTKEATVGNLDIFKGVHTRTGKELFVVRPDASLTTDKATYKVFMDDMKKIGGKYSSVVQGMLFSKGNPTEDVKALYPDGVTPFGGEAKPVTKPDEPPVVKPVEPPTSKYKALPESMEDTFGKSMRKWKQFYDEVVAERAGDVVALREVMAHMKAQSSSQDHFEDLSMYVVLDIQNLEREEYDEAVKEAGLTEDEASFGSGDSDKWKKVLASIEANPENNWMQMKKSRVESYIGQQALREARKAFVDTYFSKGDSTLHAEKYTDTEIANALSAAKKLPDTPVRDEMIQLAEIMAKRKAQIKAVVANPNGPDEIRKKAQDELNQKRADAVKNVAYKDTEIGKKIKKLRGDGIKDTKHAQEIGKLVSELMAKKLTEKGVDYALLAKTHIMYRDAVKKYEDVMAEKSTLERKVYSSRTTEKNREIAKKRLSEIANQEEGALRIEVIRIRQFINDHDHAMQTHKESAFKETMNEIREMGGSMNLEAGSAGQRAETKKDAEEIKRRFNEETAPLFPKEWIDASNTTSVKLLKPKDGRGYHRPEGGIGLVRQPDGSYIAKAPSQAELAVLPNRNLHSGRPSVYVHEMQHRMEAIIPSLNKLMRDFYVEKITDEKGKVSKTKHLGSGYSKSEVYRDIPGGWIETYMGKNYNNYSKDEPEKNRAWEIGTMSLEMIIFDAYSSKKRLEFHQTDVYEFMLGVMAGV